jgi:hypothetical protein
MKKNRIIGLALTAMALLQINAFALQFNLTGEFSGGTSPTGSTPWGTVNITDDGKGVYVTLSIANNNISRLTEWYLNFNPSKTVSKLSFSAVNTSDVFLWGANTGVNAFKADGDGTYDIRFQFSSFINPFDSSDTLKFRISSRDGADLNPEDFDYVSVGGAKGGFHTAAQVQMGGICGGSTGWLGDPQGTSGGSSNGVPDGSWTVTLLGMSVVTVEFLRRKLRKTEPQA